MRKRPRDGPELWQELGFASYRDWRLDCERARREQKAAAKTASTSTVADAQLPISTHQALPPPPLQMIATALQDHRDAPSVTHVAETLELPPPASFALPSRAQLGVSEPEPALPQQLAVDAGRRDRSARQARKAASRARRAAREERNRKRIEELDPVSEWSDPELQDPEAMEAAVAEELEEFRLTRSDAGFKGTEQQWRMMSEEQQLELTLDAVNRRRQGLLKFLEAEGARALELAQVLSSLSLQDVMQMYEHVTHCAAWDPSCSHCGVTSIKCHHATSMDGTKYPSRQEETHRLIQLNLRVSDAGTWELRPLGTCEHSNPLGLLLKAAHHETWCTSCKPQQLTIAKRLEEKYPFILSEPVHRYENIGWRDKTLWNHSWPPTLTSDMMPHMHVGDCGCVRVDGPECTCRKFRDQVGRGLCYCSFDLDDLHDQRAPATGRFPPSSTRATWYTGRHRPKRGVLGPFHDDCLCSACLYWQPIPSTEPNVTSWHDILQ